MPRRRVINLGWMGLLLAATALAGCVRPTATSREFWSLGEVKAKTDLPVWIDLAGGEPDAETGTVAPSTIAVDVESFNGDVTVIANESLLNRAKVVVTRAAVHGFTRDRTALDSLADITYDASIGTGEFGQVLRVTSATANPEPHFLRAHVHIEAPAVRGVTIRTTRGDVVLEEISGAVDVSTNEGDVRVMTDRAMTEPVTVLNRGGDIDYRVRGESTGILDCETIHGKVMHRVRHARIIIAADSDHDSLHANLNDGRNPITLRTMDGNIRVAVVPAPMRIGTMIIDP